MRLEAPALLALGCATAGATGAPQVGEATDPAAYYPLEVGWKWAYDVERDGQKILATYAVVRRHGDIAVVQAGDEDLTYVVNRDGIARRDEDGSLDFLLRGPVAAGTTWKLGAGEARIAAVRETADVPAGRFEGCVVVEQRRTDPVRVARTVLAPGIGPVLVESQIHDAGRWVTTLRARLLGVTRPGQTF